MTTFLTGTVKRGVKSINVASKREHAWLYRPTPRLILPTTLAFEPCVLIGRAQKGPVDVDMPVNNVHPIPATVTRGNLPFTRWFTSLNAFVHAKGSSVVSFVYLTVFWQIKHHVSLIPTLCPAYAYFSWLTRWIFVGTCGKSRGSLLENFGQTLCQL